ncbi:fluoride efflux transporter CrcB [Sandaracinobacteroides sp. A072]|uniref:fluoride efflux transporter CrcB n=1 Tax=Sandaracinobacteroides sp. A072 TaxID=3461146 RepID=UPI0040424326
MNAYLLVGIGGAFGAMARLGVGQLVAALGLATRPFPMATFAANLAGGLLMGLLAGWLAQRAGGAQESLRLFLGVGILGGFTTFSTFSLELVMMLQRGAFSLAALYAALSVACATLALGAGLWLARGIW